MSATFWRLPLNTPLRVPCDRLIGFDRSGYGVYTFEPGDVLSYRSPLDSFSPDTDFVVLEGGCVHVRDLVDGDRLPNDEEFALFSFCLGIVAGKLKGVESCCHEVLA